MDVVLKFEATLASGELNARNAKEQLAPYFAEGTTLQIESLELVHPMLRAGDGRLLHRGLQVRGEAVLNGKNS